MKALPGRVAYAAAKHGVVGITRVLAVEWAHRRRTFTFRFASAEAFVERFATYYGPTLKALEAAGDGRHAMTDDLRELVLSWNRLDGPVPIAVPGEYLESVGVRR